MDFRFGIGFSRKDRKRNEQSLQEAYSLCKRNDVK